MPARPIIITGFEPFGRDGRNPSAEVVEALGKKDWGIIPVVAEVLRTEYTAAEKRLQQLITDLHPLAWIGFGLSRAAKAITLERQGVNQDAATAPDNAGERRSGSVIDPQGPPLHRSTLPLQAIELNLRHRNVSMVYSDNAGQFVCNHVLYVGLGALQQVSVSPGALGGFVHLPWPIDWDEPAAGHDLRMADLMAAAEICVRQTFESVNLSARIIT